MRLTPASATDVAAILRDIAYRFSLAGYYAQTGKTKNSGLRTFTRANADLADLGMALVFVSAKTLLAADRKKGKKA